MAVKKPEDLDLEALKDQLREELMAEMKKEQARPSAAPIDPRMEEYVEVMLFKGKGKYAEDLVVGVNGEFCNIKRGMRVKIKRKFAEVIDNSEFQDEQTLWLIEARAGQDVKLADM